MSCTAHSTLYVFGRILPLSHVLLNNTEPSSDDDGSDGIDGPGLHHNDNRSLAAASGMQMQNTVHSAAAAAIAATAAATATGTGAAAATSAVTPAAAAAAGGGGGCGASMLGMSFNVQKPSGESYFICVMQCAQACVCVLVCV